MLTVLLDELEEEPDAGARRWPRPTLAFLNYAFDAKTKRFHNHLSFDRRWLDEKGSEDCHGRVVVGAGPGSGAFAAPEFSGLAGQLFAQALPVMTEFTSPRAWAFALLGIHAYLGRLSGDRLVDAIRETPDHAADGAV